MDYLNRQQEILSKLASIMHEDAGVGYDFSTISFRTGEDYQNPKSMKTYFEYEKDGVRKNDYLSVDNSIPASDAAFDLHQLMKEHTGGTWSEMTLTLTSDGQLKTEFKYPDAS